MTETPCRRHLARALGLLAAVVLVGGCLTLRSGTEAADDPDVQQILSGTLTVLAASSLSGALDEVAQDFEEAHPNLDVRVSFDASSRLAAQVLEGVEADVFLSADEDSVERLRDRALLAAPAVVVATNQLIIAVEQDNPLDVSGLADLGGGLRVALCHAAAPCGVYARQAFGRAGVAVPEASEEENVKGVLAKVQLGEVDAGVVYVTDVLAATGVSGVALPSAVQVPVVYPAAALTDAPNPDAAAAFVAFLTSTRAQAVLRDAGFGPP